MIRKFFIAFFAIFLVANFYSQTELARWNNSNFTPTVSNSNLTVGNLISFGVEKETDTFWYNNQNVNTFKTSKWPTPQTGVLDEKKYIEFTISPKSGYKLFLSEFSFTAGAYGSGKLRVDYSLNSDFSNAVTVMQPTEVTTMKEYSVTGFNSPLATNGQTVYLRIYFYNTNQFLSLLYKNGGDLGPKFKGSVVSSSTTPIVYNDNATTKTNNDIDVNILSNDDYSNSLSSIAFSQPTNGTTKLNVNNTINYLPKNGFVGKDSFTYSITNIYGTSNTATVTVDVLANGEANIIRWDNSDFYSTSELSFVENTQLKAFGGLTLITGNESLPMYKLSGGLDNSSINTSKYIQFVLSNTSTNKVIEPKKFSFIGKGNNSGNYQIRVSKLSTFDNDYTIIASGAHSTSYATISADFGTITVNPGEKLYIRIYLYNNYSDFLIQYNKGTVGPFITAKTYYSYPVSNDTTWQNGAWSNGVPTSVKNVYINSAYNTSTNGSFETNNLIIAANSPLVIATDTFLKVNGKITNLGTNSNFVIQNNANLIQTSNVVNEGESTVQKLAAIPKMGYNYWSSPVSGQNLYSFSEGYNQATTTGTGTPWNSFFVYNEKNDYFVTSIANEITLNSNSTFSPGRGYAIRGKNSDPITVSNETPTSLYEFKGGIQNGDVNDYVLKWTDSDHGYNLVGNPYPSNINFEALFELNKTKMNGLVYFWTNNDTQILVQQGSDYEGNNYAIYNATGGASATYKGSNNRKPTGSISVGQGFIIQAIKGGKDQTLSFNNSLRTSVNGTYYNKSTDKKDRFWLEFKSPNDVNNEILIGYMSKATNDFDIDFDAELLVVASDSFWSALDNRKLAIQARRSFDNEDVVNLGMKASVEGEYKIAINDREGDFAENQAVYLKDNYLNKTVNLMDGEYSFFSNEGQFDDRFQIVYKPSEVLAAENTIKKDIKIYSDQNDFVVSATNTIDEVSLYDAMGRVVYNTKSSQKEVRINKSNLPLGVYIIKAKVDNNIVTKKVLK